MGSTTLQNIKKIMGDMVLWFPKGRKEHIEKFKKWWFGAIKLEMISIQLKFGSHKLKNMIFIKLGRVLSGKKIENFGSNIAKVNSGLESIYNNSKVESIGGDSIAKSLVIGFIENWENSSLDQSIVVLE